jgi:hypothetical protein
MSKTTYAPAISRSQGKADRRLAAEAPPSLGPSPARVTRFTSRLGTQESRRTNVQYVRRDLVPRDLVPRDLVPRSTPHH